MTSSSGIKNIDTICWPLVDRYRYIMLKAFQSLDSMFTIEIKDFPTYQKSIDYTIDNADVANVDYSKPDWYDTWRTVSLSMK